MDLDAVPGSGAGPENYVDTLISWAKSEHRDFFHAFVATLAVIIVSELGDKTFFIAAIMAMSNPRTVVFTGAMSALAVMHCMSG